MTHLPKEEEGDRSFMRQKSSGNKSQNSPNAMKRENGWAHFPTRNSRLKWANHDSRGNQLGNLRAPGFQVGHAGSRWFHLVQLLSQCQTQLSTFIQLGRNAHKMAQRCAFFSGFKFSSPSPKARCYGRQEKPGMLSQAPSHTLFRNGAMRTQRLSLARGRA